MLLSPKSQKNFNEELDIFGFSDDYQDEPKVVKRPDELPITQFHIQTLLDSLAENKIGQVVANTEEPYVVRWKDIKVQIEPKYDVAISRKIFDIQGQPFWILKHWNRINTYDYKGREDIVARDIFKKVMLVANSPIEMAQNCKLEHVARSIAENIKAKNDIAFKYEQTKRINDNNFITAMSMVGSGRGTRIDTRRNSSVASVEINTSQDIKKGIIKCFISLVALSGEGDDWRLIPSFFDCKFTGSQPVEEIVGPILTALKYF